MRIGRADAGGAKGRVPNACPLSPTRLACAGRAKSPAPARASGETVDRAGVERSTGRIVIVGHATVCAATHPFNRKAPAMHTGVPGSDDRANSQQRSCVQDSRADF